MTERPVEPPRENGFQIYARLLRYVLPYWKQLGLSLLAMAITAATEPAFAALLKPMVDGSFIDGDPAIIKLMPVALIGLFLVRGIAIFSAEFGISWLSRNLVMRLRHEVFARMLRLPTRFYDTHSSGMLLSKLTFDIERISQVATSAATILIRDTLTVLLLLGWMFWLSGWLALIFLGLGPIMATVVVYISKRFRKLSRRIQHSVGEVACVAEEGIDGHLVIKTFGTQAYEQARFDAANKRNARNGLKFSATKAASTPVGQFLAATALAAVVYLATMDGVREAITTGTFISFIAAMLLLLPPLKRLTDVNATIQSGIAAGESIFGLIDEPEEQDTGSRDLSRADGRVQFQQVSFSYGEHGDVLHAIDLDVEPGQTVALVGRSGSGKTTLVSLLPRFYPLNRGSIKLDGHDIGEYRLSALRRQIAWVGQHVVLFNDTVAANIAYGCQGQVSREAIREAARAAHALEFIEKLPQGFDTPIGENGALLSGGQRQRLAIARALLKDAPILILDEATSALDTESERQIQGALEALMRGRTTLVIAHRLSTIENADRIVVLDEGRVVESGRHGELLERGGAYAALYQMQFRDQGEALASPA